MSSIGAIDKVEEVLVVRLDHKSTILDILYHDKHFSRLVKDIIGKNFKNIGLEQKICEQYEVHLHKVFANLKKEVFQLQIRRRYYQISYLPEWNDKGHVETILTIVRDITQEQNFKEELAISQVKLKMAQQIAKLGYFEWDRTNNYIYWSEQQYKNYGYVPYEVTPTIELFWSQIYPDDWNSVQRTFAEIDEKSYMEYQFRVIKADGSLGWLHSRLNVIANEQGGRSKIFGTTQDITQQKQTEERIHRVEKELAFTNQLYSRSTYLNKLLFNNYPVEQITKALNEFGIETQRTHCCFVLQLAENFVHNTEILDDTIPPLIERKQAVLIWLAERKWGLVWRCHDNIVILTSTADHIVASKQSQIQVANDIITELEKPFSHFYVKIGISGISDIPINFREIYEKAHRAVIIATTLDHSSAIHCDDIGLYEVAFQLLQDKNTCALVQKTIGCLAKHDEVRGSSLLITLECILEHESLKKVAQQLFIHQNTVIWRKRRIEKFLEMTLNKMETKMLLMLYIKIWKLKQNVL